VPVKIIGPTSVKMQAIVTR